MTWTPTERNGERWFFERDTQGCVEFRDARLEVYPGQGTMLATTSGILRPRSDHYEQDSHLLREEGHLAHWLALWAEQGWVARQASGKAEWEQATEEATPASRQLHQDLGVREEARDDWSRVKATLAALRPADLFVARKLLPTDYYARAVSEGRAHPAPVEVVPARHPGLSYANAWRLAKKRRRQVVVVVGWALRRGTWYPHAWCWDGVQERVQDPAAEHEAYWGYPLTQEEVEELATTMGDLP